MPRSRADIEAEIAALQAELDAHQPDVLRLVSAFEGVPLKADVRGHAVRYVVLNSDVALRGNYFNAESLRDWLNYHFPKENN